MATLLTLNLFLHLSTLSAKASAPQVKISVLMKVTKLNTFQYSRHTISVLFWFCTTLEKKRGKECERQEI